MKTYFIKDIISNGFIIGISTRGIVLHPEINKAKKMTEREARQILSEIRAMWHNILGNDTGELYTKRFIIFWQCI